MEYRDEVYFHSKPEAEVPFSAEEFKNRLTRIRKAMATAGIDMLYLMAPESMYYVSGYQAEWYQAQSPRQWPASSAIAVHVDHDHYILFDSERVVVRYDAAVDGSGRFSVEATVTGLPLVELNRATRPLMRMQVESGELRRMALRMDGNAKRAKGVMGLAYSDLVVRVEPGTPTELRHSMFGGVMDAMLSQAYGGGMSAERERKFSIERDPDRSMLTYLWHATREGLARNLTPEAKERMRVMLRTDAEDRRAERAERKAKKEVK